jgi:hypothetical protein
MLASYLYHVPKVKKLWSYSHKETKAHTGYSASILCSIKPLSFEVRHSKFLMMLGKFSVPQSVIIILPKLLRNGISSANYGVTYRKLLELTLGHMPNYMTNFEYLTP